jgi:non-specific serine/threonine protein kinase/serine/threonine-protein kinase
MTPAEWTRVKDLFEGCVGLPEAGRRRFLDQECGAEPAIRAEVESLLGAHDGAGGLFETPAVAAAFPARLGPWAVLGEIGSGGIGRILRARRADGQYEQEAAIKLLRPGLDSAVVSRYFDSERRILAQMNHPNIARLLDAGMTADGQPYFVMELIAGRPIDEYAESAKLGRRERVALFQKVIRAVQYAHQRLVIHRDLKPANILVTAEGEPKLLDFGVAKVLSDQPAGEAQTGLYLTPEYASPEQLRSEPVTTATDVYSLGVILYELVAGRRPYHVKTAAPHELAQAICGQDAPPPTGDDLDNVILKALEKQPERRYATPADLADDLDRYLNGYPVEARKPTLAYRAGRFVRRNKWGVAAAAALLLSLLAGLGGTLWQWRQANLERRQAERRFQELRKLANSVLFEFHDAIADLPGATPARALMLERALQYLDQLAASSPTDPALRRELAEAYLRAGDIQGGHGTPNLGHAREAARHYQQAVRLLESSDSGDRSSQRLLARAYRAVGGLANVQRAVEICERLAGGNPDSQSMNDLANAYYTMADETREAGDTKASLDWRKKELALRREIRDRDPSNPVFRGNFALTSKRLAAQLAVLGHLDEAMRHYRSALAIEENWLAAEPQSASAKMAISFSHSDIGFILNKQGKHSQAARHFRIAVRLREELAAADPKNVRARAALAAAYARLAEVLRAAGQVREASLVDARARSVPPAAESR